MKNNIQISYKKINPIGMDFDDAKRFEEIYFKAEIDGQEVGHLISSRVVSPEEFDEDKYFHNGECVPFAAFGGTKEGYRGLGIAGKLNSFANNYYLKTANVALHSDTDNSDAGKGAWRKLERKGLAKKISDNPERWKIS